MPTNESKPQMDLVKVREALKDCSYHLNDAENNPIKHAVSSLLTAVEELAGVAEESEESPDSYANPAVRFMLVEDENAHVRAYTEEMAWQAREPYRREVLARQEQARAALRKAGKIR